MAKPLKSILQLLADKAGIDPANPQFLDLLSKIDLTVDDTVAESANKFLNGAMTIDLAKIHPEVKTHFMAVAKTDPTVKAHFDATIFAGIDSRVKDLATEFGVSAADMATIDAEKNSYEKVKLLHKLSKPATGADKSALAEEVKRLNAEIVKEKELATAKQKEFADKYETDVLDYAFNSDLAGKQYANSDIDTEVNVLTAKNILASEFGKRGAKLTRKDGKLHLVSATSPELDYIENNKVMSYRDLTDSILANKKLLKVSDPNPAPNPAPRKTVPVNGEKTVDVSAVSAALRQDAKNMVAAN